MLAREFPGVIFIQSEQNLGFGRANNLGAQRAQAGTLLFLNPDTELVGPALDILYKQLRSLPSAGAVGAKLLNPDRTIQTSCVQATPTILNQAIDTELLRKWFPRASLWGIKALSACDGSWAEAEILSGACIMAGRKVFQEVGMFSSAYFMYCEDTELCYQIRQAGFKNYYIPEATIIHYEGSSTKQLQNQFSNVMMRESICRFFTKTRGRWYCAAYRASMMLSAVCRLAVLALALPFQSVCGKVKGAQYSFCKWRAILLWSLGAQTWVRKHD
jgi:hypothetical protein